VPPTSCSASAAATTPTSTTTSPTTSAPSPASRPSRPRPSSAPSSGPAPSWRPPPVTNYAAAALAAKDPANAAQRTLVTGGVGEPTPRSPYRLRKGPSRADLCDSIIFAATWALSR
jgi:hypothetical protein